MSVISIWYLRASVVPIEIFTLCETFSIRIRYNHTRMVQKNIPYAYGMYRTRTVCTIRVWYEIRVRYTTVTCSYKWPTYNACVYFMKLSYSSQDSLLHSELICIDFKLTTPTVQEFSPPQEDLHEQDQEKLGQNKIIRAASRNTITIYKCGCNLRSFKHIAN